MDQMTAIGYTEPTYKVYNRQKYDIGIRLDNGREYNIRPGSFALLTKEQIQYIDSICAGRRFFGSHMLEVVDKRENVVSLDDLAITELPKEECVLTEEDITAALKKSVKSIEAWLDSINDVTELHAIYSVASKMDLPASKLKVLRNKMPEKDWFDELT